MDTNTDKLARRFRSACSYDSGNVELRGLKRRWDQVGYGDVASRVAILHAFERLSLRKVSAGAAAVAVPYTATGFHSGQHDAASQHLRTDVDIRIVAQPSREDIYALEHMSKFLTQGVTHKSPVYFGNHESCPLRPMVLVYGEHHDCAHLRQRFRLDPRSVFIMGIDAPDSASAHCPYASIYMFGGSALFSPVHLAVKLEADKWIERPCVLAYMAHRATGRERGFRTAVFRRLAKLLLDAKVCAKSQIWCFGSFQDKKVATDKQRWRQDLEATLRSDGVSRSLDRAVFIYRTCRFVIAVENNRNEGYMSEKRFLPALAGAVPIAWGCKALRRTIDRKACVDLFDFSETRAEEAARSAFTQIQRALKNPPNLKKPFVKEDVLQWYSAPPLSEARAKLKRWLAEL